MDHRDGALAMTGQPSVLVVAGSDSSGGAGIARDIETVSAIGLGTCIAVTAVTVQTHGAVEHIELMSADLVARQMCAALRANPVAAVKIGVLGTRATVEAVAEVLSRYPDIPVVLDPVLASTSGRKLLSEEALAALGRELMPICRLVTPNIPELALLVGSAPAEDEAALVRQGHVLLDAGAPAVLVKGGHATGEQSTDLLLRRHHAPERFEAARLAGGLRGTGCMLASAIAAYLALGETLCASVGQGKRFVFAKFSAGRNSPR